MPHQDFFTDSRPDDTRSKVSNLTMYRGDTMSFKLYLKVDDCPVDVTNGTFWFTVKEYINETDGEALIVKTTGDGITILNAPLGQILVTLNPGDTNVLYINETTTYYWDLQYQDINGIVQTVFIGRLTIIQDVTRAIGPEPPYIPSGPAGPVRVVAWDYTPLSSDRLILVNSTLEPITITLPPSHVQGKVYEIKDHYGTSAINNITIISSDGDLIDQLNDYTLSTNYQSITVVSDGNKWNII